MKVFKKILKYTSIVLAFLCVYLYLGMVVMPKDASSEAGARYYSAVAITKEKDNSLDVLFMGDSNVYADIDPLLFYKGTGIRSFDCAFGRQSINAVRNQLKKLLKKQSPKLVVLDIDCIFEKNTFFVGSNVYDYIGLGSLISYHSRWKEITWKDFYTIPKAKKDKLKGYVYDNAVVEVKVKENFMKDTGAKPAKLQKNVEKDLKKIKEMCDKAGTKLLLIHCPTKTWSNAKSNAAQKLANKFGLEYFDMNLNYESLGIDFSQHYATDLGTHMNYQGAKIVTNYLVEIVEERITNGTYVIDDHRGQESGAEWDSLVEELDLIGEKYYVKNRI